jgi:thiol-disulfide isomerase/thioredoxin
VVPEQFTELFTEAFTMKQQVVSRVGAVVVMVAMAGVAMGQTHAPEIARAGLGEHRKAMDALELKPAPADWLASLSEFAGGPAQTAESLKGKVVVVATWTAWHPPSVQALTRASRLAETLGGKGLVVIAAHRAERYETATKLATERGLKVLVAKDSGALRTSLGADSDPNFYVIDRAGNVRFADVAGDALEAAVNLLLAETPESAAKVPGLVQAAGAAAPAAAVTTRTVAEIDQAGRRPTVQFARPNEAAYAAAPWPEHNKDGGNSSISDLGLGGDNKQGKPFEAFDTLLTAGLWLTPRPESNAGRLTLVYFWTPEEFPGYRFTPQVEEMQRNNLNDLVVVAVTGPEVGSSAGSSNNKPKDQKNSERWLRENPSGLAFVWDQGSTRFTGAGANQVPVVYLMSTDGVVRWQGHPLDPDFRRALDVCLSVDPGVRARRAAEAAAMSGGAKADAPAGKSDAPAGKGG